jgi:hypothetical protein
LLHTGGRNQVPAGLDGGDGGENHVPSGLDGGDTVLCLENDAVGCDGISSSVSQMSAHLSEASPDTEPLDELAISVLLGLPNSATSVNLKLLYSKHMSVYAR